MCMYVLGPGLGGAYKNTTNLVPFPKGKPRLGLYSIFKVNKSANFGMSRNHSY